MAVALLTDDQRIAADRLVASLPDWSRIYGVAEQSERTKALKAGHPYDVNVEEIGRSRSGRPVEAVTVGRGAMTVMLLGFPHPDEGVGALMADHVLRFAVERPDSFRHLNTRLVVVKCWDIDGAFLNEGWFGGASSLEQQAKTHFRPPAAMQMEWTFPVEYKSHRWSEVPPETEAVRRLIDRERPHLMLGLHNAAFNDPYFYLSREAPEAYGALAQAVEAERMAMSDRSPDVPFEVPLARGIFKMYGLREYFDYYEKFTPERLQHLKRGACSDEYLAATVPHSFSFNAEVPRALDRRLRDKTVTSRDLRQVVMARTFQHNAEMKRMDGEMTPLIERNGTLGSLLKESVRQHIEEGRDRAQESNNDVGTDPQYARSATVADVFENEVVGPLEDMLVLGEGWRAASEYAAEGDPQAKKAVSALSARITGLAAVVQGKSKFEPVALKRSAGVQLRALMALLGWRVNVMGL
jgi:hypothetical protein